MINKMTPIALAAHRAYISEMDHLYDEPNQINGFSAPKNNCCNLYTDKNYGGTMKSVCVGGD